MMGEALSSADTATVIVNKNRLEYPMCKIIM
jgi:hypothetical protein